jgi:arylsulfatase A-like enzyme
VLAYLGERETARDQRPFLIHFGFSHPHDTRDGKPELLTQYGATNHTDPAQPPAAHPRQPPLPANYLPAHPFPIGHPGLRDEVAVSGVWERRDPATIRNEIGRQLACSENIDTQLGRVLRRLEAMGELEHTYVFYTADHGMAIGRHGLQGKQNLYEHTWRVPLLVQGPGIRPGSRAQGNVYLSDLLATYCDLAGIPPPATNEGRSFRPVLEGRAATVRDTLYGVYCGGTRPGIRAVRHGDWKLVQHDVLDGKVRELQLFNLRENPDEFLAAHHDPAVVALTGRRPAPHQVNLAGDPRHAAKLRELQALLLAEMRRHDDPFRLWDQPSDGLTPPAPPRETPRAKGKAKTGE